MKRSYEGRRRVEKAVLRELLAGQVHDGPTGHGLKLGEDVDGLDRELSDECARARRVGAADGDPRNRTDRHVGPSDLRAADEELPALVRVEADEQAFAREVWADDLGDLIVDEFLWIRRWLDVLPRVQRDEQFSGLDGLQGRDPVQRAEMSARIRANVRMPRSLRKGIRSMRKRFWSLAT